MRIEERRVSVALGVVLALAVALFPALARVLLSDHAYWIQIYIWILFFAMCATAWNIIGASPGNTPSAMQPSLESAPTPPR